MKHALEKLDVARAGGPALDLVHAHRGPRVYGRIDVTKRPFVRGYLPIRVHVPLAEHQDELLLCKFSINERERDAVKRQIPRRIPRVLPLVGHRDDIGVVKVLPP